MTTMIERVARKLCWIRGYEPDQLEPGDDPYGNDTSLIDGRMPNGDPAHFMWRQFVKPARELFAEMREPTEAMCEAAPFVYDQVLPSDTWRAMIDAAITEGEDA